MAFYPCCCLSLRTGVLLIGIFELISWSVFMRNSFSALLYTAAVSQIVHQFQDNETYSENSDISSEMDTTLQQLQSTYIIAGIALSACMVKIVVACVLLFGVQRNSTRMIGIWIIVKIVSVFFKIGALAASLFYAGAPAWTLYTYTGYTYSYGPVDRPFIYAFGIGLAVYFIWVAHSLVKELHAAGTEKEKDIGEGASKNGNGKGGLVHKF